ncbi:MAG TPA: NADPH-dependent FMN reductase [Longimicrobium sp.]|nr:NADPH-dependent FMN reductase [Longimicrobium sp.]
MKILGFAGSLRAESYNRALLEAARELAPEGMDVEVWDGLGELPFYNADLDNDEMRPPPVRDFKRRVAEADALLIATPEYNYSIPGVLKNAIDWASRPGYRSVLVGKPVGIIGASGGAIGTARGQAHLREVLFSNLAQVFPHPGVGVSGSASKFREGRLADETTRAFVADYLRAFARFVEAREVRPYAPPPPPPKPAG